MTGRPRIITDNRSLLSHYHELQPGDIVRGRVRLRPKEEHLLLDLSRRGVLSVPSFISQLCSRSKTLQARLYEWAMVSGTRVIYTIHDLLEAVNDYTGHTIGEVVVKLEDKNAGLGIFRFSSIEDVYTQSALGHLLYPYVVQPLQEECRDIRVIALDDYWEAYERINPENFRNNLHCGGKSHPVELTDAQRQLCTRVMAQLEFPYAHLDLLINGNGATYLGEINLRGGLRGARITPEDYRRRVDTIEETWCRRLVADSKKKGEPQTGTLL